jgi:hypothetical protein
LRSGASLKEVRSAPFTGLKKDIKTHAKEKLFSSMMKKEKKIKNIAMFSK